MEKEPKRLIVRILEYAAIFAVAAFLLRLGVAYLTEIWAVVLVIAVVAVGIAAGYLGYKNKVEW